MASQMFSAQPQDRQGGEPFLPMERGGEQDLFRAVSAAQQQAEDFPAQDAAADGDGV